MSWAPNLRQLEVESSGPFERLGARGVFDQATKSLERLEADMDLILEEMKKDGG